ncbi:MAG: GC-type dockerin domain-anchored protein [Phycisphaerales bacterium JB040]
MIHRAQFVSLATIITALGLSTPDTGAQPIYLNDDAGVTVSLGASMAAEPFANRSTADSLASIINLDSASDVDTHAQSTHVWVSGGHLEVDFDLGDSYDLTTMHFWNYYTETYDVDNIDMVFYNESGVEIGQPIGIQPQMSSGNPVVAEHIAVDFPSGVRFINMVLSGTNNQVDFQNLGFTGMLSSDCRADTNNDGVLDNGDIGAFVNSFLAGDLAADFTDDGILDNGDIGAFVTAFLAGCP